MSSKALRRSLFWLGAASFLYAAASYVYFATLKANRIKLEAPIKQLCVATFFQQDRTQACTIYQDLYKDGTVLIESSGARCLYKDASDGSFPSTSMSQYRSLTLLRIEQFSYAKS